MTSALLDAGRAHRPDLRAVAIGDQARRRAIVQQRYAACANADAVRRDDAVNRLVLRLRERGNNTGCG